MNTNSESGLFVYAKDLEPVALFYEQLLRLTRTHPRPEIVVLSSASLNLVVHAIPAEIAASIEITVPPKAREDCALKFFTTVESLEAAREVAECHGGAVLAGQWEGPDFVACNAVDPEGNVFQLRAGRALTTY